MSRKILPLLYTSCLLFLTIEILAQESGEKIRIESQDELPRFTYPANVSAVEIVQSPIAYRAFTPQVIADIEDTLARYEIADASAERGLISVLQAHAMVEQDFEKALELALEIRALQDKPAEKLLSGLISEAIATAASEHDFGSPAFIERVGMVYGEKLSQLPWDIVQDRVESTKGSLEIWSENLFIGIVEERIEPARAESETVSGETAHSLINYRYLITTLLPLRDSLVAALSDYIDNNRVEKPDIWAARDVDLTGRDNLTPVTVAIWDSGVDPEIFGETNQLWVNPGEKEDATDNDENGFVDDLYGIGYNLKGFKVTEPLFPLPEEVAPRYEELLDMYKGLSDLRAAVESDEARAFRKKMSALEKDAVRPFIEDIGILGNTIHGTHVAGIAAEGNPAARLLNARITFDYRMIPDRPLLEDYIRFARSAQEAVDYFKANGVRVVNMSWGGDQKSIEADYETTAVGDDAGMRQEMARILFDISYDGLVAAMASAPDILFIPAAGNSDEDIQFTKDIPASIDLPNVFVVGAVDQAGDETSFTSYGANVRAHANGFEVDSYVPGGRRLKLSGTSMAAPNVANLAAKLLAIDPSLTPEEVISLIRLGATTSEDGRRFLIHPARTIELLEIKMRSDS